jgi:hypothetical protein
MFDSSTCLLQRDVGLVIAHKGRLAAIAFNPLGNQVATASVKVSQ